MPTRPTHDDAPDDPVPLTPDPALCGARVQAVQQPDALSVVLETHRPGHGTARWRFSLDAEGARLGRTFRKATRGSRPPVFCQWLRTRLEGGRIEQVTLPQPQRLELAIAQPETRYRLVLELNRRDSNLLLLDAEGCLLIALRHPSLPDRKLSPGEPYRPPPRLHAWPPGVPLADRYPAPDEPTARALERCWEERGQAASLHARLGPARQHVRRERKRLQRRQEHLQADAAATAEAERWRRWGELLQVHRGLLHAGMASVAVPDVFQADQPTVTIPLDPDAEPGANIERCFRHYRKRRAAAPHVEQRSAATGAELEALAQVAERIDAARTATELDALAADLPAALGAGAGRLARLLRGAPAAGGDPSGLAAGLAPGAATAARGPMRRLSADGYAILVGRSARENDRLTFRLAQGRDWWLHAQGLPGSHVVVLNPAGAALPPRTLHEAAWLAAYYSQGRASGRVEVDYTQRKHVRRLKGGEPGQVTFSQNRTVLVNLDDSALRQVLERVDA